MRAYGIGYTNPLPRPVAPRRELRKGGEISVRFILISMGPGCFHPRNSAALVSTGAAVTLQWGRDVSIPEMPRAQPARLPPARLQWGRDVSIPEMSCRGHALGTCLWLQWGRDVSIPEMWGRRR